MNRFDMLKKEPVSQLMPVPFATTMQLSALISGPARPPVALLNSPLTELPDTNELLTDTRLPAPASTPDEVLPVIVQRSMKPRIAVAPADGLSWMPVPFSRTTVFTTNRRPPPVR